jgi:hypothetical protein
VKPGAAFPDLDPLVRTDLFSRVNPPPGRPIERYAGAPWPGGAFDVL